MKSGLSKGKKVKTLAEARAEFHRSGRSVISWARAHNFCPNLVYLVLDGKRPGLRGQSHRIAVRLGIKDGVIEEGATRPMTHQDLAARPLAPSGPGHEN